MIKAASMSAIALAIIIASIAISGAAAEEASSKAAKKNYKLSFYCATEDGSKSANITLKGRSSNAYKKHITKISYKLSPNASKSNGNRIKIIDAVWTEIAGGVEKKVKFNSGARLTRNGQWKTLNTDFYLDRGFTAPDTAFVKFDSPDNKSSCKDIK